MTYRFKPTEVEAIQIPAGLTVSLDITETGQELPTGTKAQGEDWLVVLADRLVVFPNEQFHSQFEPMNGRKPKLKPKLLCKPKTAQAAPALPKATVPQGTIGQLILEALSEKARTVGELVEHWKQKGRVLSKPSVSATLNVLKHQGRVENNGFGEWRLL